jgi:FlaA1/EpsC-like NDP-sugar epimerase/lipopolysaccharide/colanic/teichoic acid biosynthesis glycosyltransferase
MAEVPSNVTHESSTEIRTPLLSRCLDLIIAGMGLILLAPVFIVIAFLIKVSSTGPVFHRANRVGRHGYPFKLYKFRSMYLNADCNGPGITLQNDPRITPLGRFLRRTKLDELPQLINVLRGDMSMVGPRPEDPRYVALYTPTQRQVLAARPGITSPASLDYFDEETLLTGEDWETIYCNKIMPRKLSIDLAYMQRCTIWSDLILILRTITTVVTGEKRINSILELRNRHLFILDVIALLVIPSLALTLRLDGLNWWPRIGQALLFFTLVASLVKIPIFYQLGLYNRFWRYAGTGDLFRVLIAIGLSTTVLALLFIAAHTTLEQYGLAMFRTLPLLDGLLTFPAIGGLRLGLRGLYHWHRQRRGVVGGRRVLVVGAGESGNMVVREMRANPQLDMEPVAFVDDDPAKIGTRIQDLPVLGPSHQIARYASELGIQRIIVAVPSAPFGRLRQIMATCQETGIATDTLPGVYELLAGSKTVSPLPEVNINCLLRREPVEVDPAEVATVLGDATVLVTGAGGSIGSELCRQIARHAPRRIILLGHGENSIFEIDLDLHLSFPGLITHPVIADVRDQEQMNWVVEKYRPDSIFHAAAHKHVHLMEANVEEAITNNVIGTQMVLRAAGEYGVERFVLVSTNEAINPTSVMGLTKRIAELLVATAAQRSGRAYMAVRFGNVLGSRGSVVSVFQRQIAAGGPLTVTHPDMCRYFMTIAEAVQLVLQATVLGQGGEVFVLDMGRPVQILDLATDLIKLSGLEPGRDIKIIYTGIRPGEKLYEELLLGGEDYQRTKHEKILVVTNENTIDTENLEQTVARLVNLPRPMQPRVAIECMGTIVPEYSPLSQPSRPTARPEVSSSGPLYPRTFPSRA